LGRQLKKKGTARSVLKLLKLNERERKESGKRGQREAAFNKQQIPVYGCKGPQAVSARPSGRRRFKRRHGFLKIR
jgi:hypothetical protein